MAESPSQETLRFMERQLQTNKELSQGIQEVKEIALEMRATIHNIHEQTLKTNGRVDKHDDFLNKYGDSIKESYENAKNDKRVIRNLFWKIVAIASVVTLFGINADKLISLF